MMAQQYDGLNRITAETFPDSEAVSYSYNTAGWLSTVTGYISGITYNARGQKTALTYANNLTTTWTFDANNFRVTNRTTSSNQQNLTYGYDNNGNITTITDSLFTASRVFQYDDLNRLINASGSFGPNQSQSACIYGYNPIGDITNKCGTAFTYGDAMHPSAVTFNPATGRNYSYDANGNMLSRGTQTLAWDIENRVTSVSISGGGSTLMEYDYTGMRLKKNAPTGITLYPFKGYEIDPNGTISKFIKIGSESFASKKRTSSGTTTQYFYHNDHLGSVNVITDITATRVQRNEYEPWGEVSRSEGATPGSSPTVDLNHRFTGQELDPETGLHYYGGRYYDQEIGRFASPDPYVQEPDNPQNLNRYTYVLDNPQNYVDPNGHFFWAIFSAIASILTSISAISAGVIVTEGMIVVGVELGAVLQGAFIGIGGVASAAIQLQKQAEIRQQVKQSGAKQSAQEARPQQQNRLAQDAPGNDYPDENPWWRNVLDSIFSDARASDKEGMPFPPNPSLIHRFNLPGGGGVAGKLPPRALSRDLPRPLPRGVTQEQFGDRIMRWGTGDEAARARIKTLKLGELQQGGVTPEIAESWRNFYNAVKIENPANPSAQGRFELMSRAVELLGGR